MAGKPVQAAVADKWLACLVCGKGEFSERPVKLNTTGAEFLGVEWVNRTATALICTNCGYVHEFLGDAVKLYEAGQAAN